MSLFPNQPGLGVEDFRRLGVRPNELRLAVIRKAAARSTRSIAQQQLDSPTPQTAILLSRVATSAYRLLDPRQRIDAHHRAHLGRILPNTLSRASQTNFISNVAAAVLSSTGANLPSESDDEEMVDWLPAFESSGSGATVGHNTFQQNPVQLDVGDVWLRNLVADDLLDSTPMSRRLKRLRVRILHPWIVFSIGGLIVGTALGLVTLGPRLANSQFRLVNDTKTETTLDVVPPQKLVVVRPVVVDPLPSAESIAAVVAEPLPAPVAKSEVVESEPITSSRSEIRHEGWTLDPSWLAALDLLRENVVASIPVQANPLTNQDHLKLEDLASCEYLLRDGSLEQCKEVAERLSIASRLAGDQATADAADQYVETVGQIRRLRDVSAEVVERFGDLANVPAKIDEASNMGRYHCLMLRHWNPQSLDWLAKSSDFRLAGLARQELAMTEDRTADQIAEMSNRWLAAADRTSGRAAESMRLHAIDLMRCAADSCSGLKRLELQRSIEVQLATVPTHLREAHLVSTVAASNFTPSIFDASEPAESVPQPLTVSVGEMSGRVFITSDVSASDLGGLDDIGVQIDYQLDVPITRSMFDAIKARLDRDFLGTKITIRLLGELVIDDDRDVVFTLAAGDTDLHQMVFVDDQSIELDPLDASTRHSLSAGRHLIEWRIQTSDLISKVAFGVHDPTTGRRIPLVSITNRDAATRLTVAMLRSSD